MENHKAAYWYPRLLIGALFLFIIYGFGTLPIRFFDTDLWYHLTGGKYIWENGATPTEAFFSFLEGTRTRADYFWLFRCLVFSVYQLGGYYGLSILQAVFFIATMVVTFFVLRPEEESDSGKIWVAIFLMICCSLVSLRFQILRPHVVSYFCTILSIYIVEKRPEKIWLLPPIILWWVNSHGITYPIIGLLLFCYGGEYLYQKLKEKESPTRTFWIIASFVALSPLMTPHHINLVPVPFIPTEYASLYINELKAFSWSYLVSFKFSLVWISKETILMLYFTIISLWFIYASTQRKIRFAHFFLYVGAFLLLIRGRRFVNEFVFLTIPLACHVVHYLQSKVNREYVIPVSLWFAITFVNGMNLQLNSTGYPLEDKKVPVGTMAFFQKLDTPSNILVHPNHGGYFQWKLYPQYKIPMDMQVPHLFSDDDYYFVYNSGSDMVTLENFLDTYHPEFICAFLETKTFQKQSVPEHYKVVYFDNVYVVFANEKKLPEIVDFYEVKVADPFPQEDINLADVDNEKIIVLQKELERMLEVYPRNYLALTYMALAYQKQRNYSKAVEFAQQLLEYFPEKMMSYKIAGDLFAFERDFASAIETYSVAVENTSSTSQQELLYRKIAGCYLQLENFEKAYSYYKKGIPVYQRRDWDYKEMVLFGQAAEKFGKIEEAAKIYQYALWMTPQKDWEARTLIQQLQKQLKTK